MKTAIYSISLLLLPLVLMFIVYHFSALKKVFSVIFKPFALILKGLTILYKYSKDGTKLATEFDKQNQTDLPKMYKPKSLVLRILLGLLKILLKLFYFFTLFSVRFSKVVLKILEIVIAILLLPITLCQLLPISLELIYDTFVGPFTREQDYDYVLAMSAYKGAAAFLLVITSGFWFPFLIGFIDGLFQNINHSGITGPDPWFPFISGLCYMFAFIFFFGTVSMPILTIAAGVTHNIVVRESVLNSGLILLDEDEEKLDSMTRTYFISTVVETACLKIIK